MMPGVSQGSTEGRILHSSPGLPVPAPIISQGQGCREAHGEPSMFSPSPFPSQHPPPCPSPCLWLPLAPQARQG